MSGIKIGVAIAPENVFKIAEDAKKFGFDSIWVSDEVLEIPPRFKPDGWSILSALAVKTKKIKIGTAVTCPNKRHPAISAQTAATIDWMSNGRFIMGIGPGGP
jgi:alkanesulfonate monooxygenase SsuD/methylene tetrahydromethanopterin reductase-like flavin-dependent oxidoreductase (luciferase family)